MNDTRYIQVDVNLHLQIERVVEVSDTEMDVTFICIDGTQEGAMHKERYWLTGIKRDDHGEITNHGGLWRVRKLMIACGLYTINEKAEKHVTMPFDTKQLLEKIIIADAVKKENTSGKEYTNLVNERELPKSGMGGIAV